MERGWQFTIQCIRYNHDHRTGNGRLQNRLSTNCSGESTTLNNLKLISLAAVVGALIGALLFAGFNLLTGFAQPAQSFSYQPGISLAAPAVVSVYSSETLDNPASSDPLAGMGASLMPQHRTSQGSGVIVSAEGLVLTNQHLIAQADVINVALTDGRLFAAKLVGVDRETDLALLSITSPEPLPFRELNTRYQAEVGDIVLAIGNPFGVGQTVTQGIVSATDRRIGDAQLKRFLQIDAAINPGNSGGALITPDGQLVGINTAIISHAEGADGIGFAIPADLVHRVATELATHGRVIRGWLGVGIANLHQVPVLYQITRKGAVVSSIVPGSPAHQAGLSPGDVITAVEDTEVASARQLLTHITDMKPGDQLRLTGLRVRRGEVTETLWEVRLSERPAPAESD